MSGIVLLDGKEGCETVGSCHAHKQLDILRGKGNSKGRHDCNKREHDLEFKEGIKIMSENVIAGWLESPLLGVQGRKERGFCAKMC